MGEMAVTVLIDLLKIVLLIFLPAIALGVPVMVYLERRISAFIQDRLGPNRVGPYGILQALADAVKALLKEDVVPGHVNKVIYTLAPAMAMIPALMTFAILPWGTHINMPGFTIPLPGGKSWEIAARNIPLVVADLDIGILYVFAISSLGVYGIVMAGWAANSKYPMLGGIRASAQMISYEVALALAVVGVFMITSDLNLSRIVRHQIEHGWNVFYQPIGFVIFVISMFAETNRLPFDLPEAENELVSGYHTEYSSMKFAFFFMAEYSNMILLSMITTTLFLGGWHLPFVTEHLAEGSAASALVSVSVVAAKSSLILFLFIWVRWTLPRFRYDQLMQLGWKVFLPVSGLNVAVTGLVIGLLDFGRAA